MPVLLDLNNRVFQSQWFSLEKEDRNAVLQSCIKLAALDWEALYGNKGFRCELIHSCRAPDGSKLYSLRITRRIRVVARRRGEFLELLTLHPDHDSGQALPGVSQALKKVGLSITSGKTAVEVLVFDDIREPSEN